MLADTSGFDPINVLIVFGIGALALLTFLFIGATIEQRTKRNAWAAEQQRIAEQKRREDDLRGQQDEAARRQRQQQAEAEKQRKQEEFELAVQASTTQAIQKLREEADERYRTALGTNTMDERERRLRDALLLFSRTGQVLTVRVFASPTGWLGMEWIQDPGRPRPLRVVCRRDDKILAVEHVYRGIVGDILEPGREYDFSFAAWDDRGRDLEKGFQFVAKIPTREQWDARIPSDEPKPAEDPLEKQNRIAETIKLMASEGEYWEKLRREVHEQINAGNLDENAKRQLRASVDARILNARTEFNL